ncbi:MAG: MFS transporter [Bacteroidetes bacterium]|nr:MFS transporter [Bacteroidota bacterium]
MTEAIKNSLRDSKKARWTALVVVSLSMFGAYFFNYALSPVKPMLESILGWTSSDFGIYTSSYTWFNVFLFMLIFSGIILDKMGIRFTGLAATSMMAIGTGLNYWALIHVFPDGATIFGIKTQVVISAIGFGIFGVGTEAGGITVSKAVVKWFKGKEMALAMGLQMSIARLGTALALGIALPVAKSYNFTSPVLLAFVFMLIALGAFIIYTFMDRKLDTSIATTIDVGTEEDKFELKDILFIIKNKGFWYIAILCVLFYSAVFPFLFYATDLMINKYQVNPNLAGAIPALLPFGTIFLTPLFGTIYDRKGKGATIMIIGSLILIVVHGILTIPFLTSWWVATVMVIVLGIGFSLVPAAMWPSVPKIIPEKQLGTAYAVIFWIQNIGLWAIPLLLGIILDSTNPQVSPNKTLVRDAITDAYMAKFSNNTYQFSEKDIARMAERASSMTIDSIVQVTNYEPVSNADLNREDLKKNISEVTAKGLVGITTVGDEDAFKETVKKTTVKAVFPLIEGKKLNLRYDYFYDLVLFTSLGIVSLLFAFLLKAEDRKKGYGLELPNIAEKAEEIKEQS